MSFSWYAVSVKPRHERSVSLILENKGLEVFSPTCRMIRRWSDRIKNIEMPLFPGYVFGRFGFEQRMAVLMSPGVNAIVSAGRQPAPVLEEEIQAVQRIIASGRHTVPWPYLAAGRKVQIVAGCLEGLTGTVVRDKSIYRVVVNVELLQRSVAVEIARDDLAPSSPPHNTVSQLSLGPAGPVWQ